MGKDMDDIINGMRMDKRGLKKNTKMEYQTAYILGGIVMDR